MREEEPDDALNQPQQEDRDSIWSIPLSRRALYFGLFTVYALAGIGFLIWYEVFVNTTDTWQQTILSITQGIGVNTVGAAGLALLTIEGPKTVMVVADYITQRWLNPLKERRRQEAERIRADAEAEAERVRAEAERIRADAERRRADSEAEAERIRAEAEAEAERRRADSEAEAERIIADAEAEAERIREEGRAGGEAQN